MSLKSYFLHASLLLMLLFAAGLPAQAQTVRIDVLSLNVFGLPAPLGQNVAERAARIGSTLSAYGLIGLQETFGNQTDAIAETFRQKGGSAYARFQPQHKRLLRSGLEIFSRYEILQTDFVAFALSSDSDALARKGVAFARVLIPNIGPVDFYDTHYQAEDDRSASDPRQKLRQLISGFWPGFALPHDELRLHDNEVMSAFVVRHERGYPTILLGDFNAGDDSPVIPDLLKRLGLQDAFRTLHPDDPGYSSDGELNPLRRSRTRHRHDYTLYKSGKRVSLRPLSSVLVYNRPGEIISDHFGIHTRFELSIRPVATGASNPIIL